MGRLNEQGLQRLVGNIKEDVSSNIALVNTEVENAKGDILGIKNELTKSENTKYTTVNGIKEFDVVRDGYVDNVVIEGETLINYANNVKPYGLTESNGSIVTTRGSVSEDSNGVYSITTGGDWDDFGDIISVKPNTNYVFSANIVDKKSTRINLVVAFFKQYPVLNSAGANTSQYLSLVKITDAPTGLVNLPFTTPEGCNYVLYATSHETNGVVDKVSNYMVIEGNTPSRPYFNGLKSVGQGDKVEVLTRCEDGNLFDGFMELGSFGSIGQPIENTSCVRSVNFTPITKTIPFTSWNDKGYGTYFYYYDSGYNFIKAGGDIPPNARYFKFRTIIGNVENDPSVKFVVSYEQVDKFIELKQDKKQILTTLRSTPSSVKDEIIKQGNKYYKIQRCGEEIVKSSMFVESTGTNLKTVYGGRFKISNTNVKQLSSVYCSNIECNGIATDWTTEEKENLMITSASGGGELFIWFKVWRNRLSSATVEGVKEFVEKNNIVVVYELETPITTELPNFNPRTFSDKTTFLLNSGAVQCEGSFEVTGSLVSGLEVMSNKISSLDTVATNFRNIITSPELPADSQGNDGDIWIKYI